MKKKNRDREMEGICTRLINLCNPKAERIALNIEIYQKDGNTYTICYDLYDEVIRYQLNEGQIEGSETDDSVF